MALQVTTLHPTVGAEVASDLASMLGGKSGDAFQSLLLKHGVLLFRNVDVDDPQLLTFAKTIAELPISQILYPPSQEPLSVTIQAYLGNFQLGTGTAMTVIGLVEIFGVIVVALGLYRVVTPRGWQRIGWTGVGA